MPRKAKRQPAFVADFVTESNLIEGLTRPVRREEFIATTNFLMLPALTIEMVRQFVFVMQPDAWLRNSTRIPRVGVGSHVAPPSGPEIEAEMGHILSDAVGNLQHPYIVHHRYETLHPFTDGNGRSGRAIWAWQVLHFKYPYGLELGFLHSWYYQSLQHGGPA